jgi:hypothetical protein
MKASLDLDGGILFAGSRVQEPHLSDAALAEFAGAYKSAELDATYNLSIEKGTLMLRNGWNSLLKLIPIAPDVLDTENLGTLVFLRDANHHVSGLRLFAGGVRDVSFDKTN